MQWKGWIYRGEPCHKVFFKSSDGSFSGVAAVTVGRDQLVLYVIGCKKGLQSGRCLIIESLKFWFETLGGEFLMDVIICFYPFLVGPRFNWDDLNMVAVINVADHNVRVALAGSDREFFRQVCVKLTLIDQDGINKMGFCAQICVSFWHIVNWCL
jgi:hypothetical protein